MHQPKGPWARDWCLSEVKPIHPWVPHPPGSPQHSPQPEGRAPGCSLPLSFPPVVAATENKPKPTQNKIFGRVPPCSCRLPAPPGMPHMSRRKAAGPPGSQRGAQGWGGLGTGRGMWMGGGAEGEGTPQPCSCHCHLCAGAAGWGRQKEPVTGEVGGTGSILESLWSR